jgi:MFS family permease
LIAAGLVVVAITVGNDWSTVTVILGLLVVGIGEGTLLTLLFNVLVSASPKRLAGDVGALRGVANNVSNALGAAFASVVAVGLLGLFLTSAYSRSELPHELQTRAVSGGAQRCRFAIWRVKRSPSGVVTRYAAGGRLAPR